ncbi:hypothetical protein [Leifsonia sp. 2MCAF36]|uniref:hypothetical protein n=1 Tax=Leifsonia sp. 2MCAF36 TaxID=3232988 RepID=UPI003F9B3B9C
MTATRLPAVVHTALRQHPWLVGSFALLVMIASAGVPAAIAVADHSKADSEYQQARRSLASVSAQLTAARTDFGKTRADVSALAGQLQQLTSAAHDYLTSSQLGLVTASSDRLSGALALPAGEQATPREATGTRNSSTAELQSAAATLTRQAADERGWLATTRRAVDELSVARDLASARLDAITSGMAQADDTPAVPGVSASLAAVLAAYPRADQASKDALTASATAATAAGAAHKPLVASLLDFLGKAQAVHDSQAAVDAAAAKAAAEAAAQAVAEAQAGGSAGKTAPTNPAPPRNSPGSSSGGSGGTLTPLPSPNFDLVTHTPQVLLPYGGVTPAGIPYEPGCGNQKFMYEQQARNHGFEIISLNPPWAFDYHAFPTADGWSVDVYECMPTPQG